MPRVSRPFAAQWHGSCALDMDFIDEGDEIVMIDGEASHVECARDAGLIPDPDDEREPEEGEVGDFFD
jgi:hypothetical protein